MNKERGGGYEVYRSGWGPYLLHKEVVLTRALIIDIGDFVVLPKDSVISYPNESTSFNSKVVLMVFSSRL